MMTAHLTVLVLALLQPSTCWLTVLQPPPARHAPPRCCAEAAPPKRVRRNKYAQHSKADAVRESLRFSRIDDPATAAATTPATTTPPAPPKIRVRGEWTYPDAAAVDQRDPTTFGFTEIGTVLGAHGINGELKVRTESDFGPQRLCERGVRWLRRPRRRAPREVALLGGRKGPGAGVYLVTLDGVGSREAAAALKGSTFFARREVRPAQLAADELLVWELEGLTVARAAVGAGAGELEDGELAAGDTIGRVVGVVPREEITGNPELGNDLLEVELGGGEEVGEEEAAVVAGEGDGPDTVLIPYVPQIVRAVLPERRLVLVDPPEGLLDLVQPKRRARVVIRGLLKAEGAT